METQPFMKGPQREATSREQPSSDVKRSIMQYVFLADSVPRELADKMGSCDKLCVGIIHVRWVKNSMCLVRCQRLSLSPHLLPLSIEVEMRSNVVRMQHYIIIVVIIDT